MRLWAFCTRTLRRPSRSPQRYSASRRRIVGLFVGSEPNPTEFQENSLDLAERESGLFFGLAFGMGGIGAAVLGELADWTSIEFVYHVCSFLPMIGLLAVFLPNVERPSHVTRISHS